MTSPFHAGELAVQERAGESAMAERNGVIIGPVIPHAAIPFIRQRRAIVTGWADANGQRWASLIQGEPGFLEPSADRRSLRIALERPLAPVADPRIGLLAIDRATRRRLRMNGRVTVHEPEVLVVALDEAYPNCPKYIQPPNTEPFASTELADVARRATAFYVTTGHPDGHFDVSHRGGNAGFIQVEADGSLLIPDYAGNGMFNTLGNLTVDARAGLLFVDETTGRTLSVTGRVEILWHGTERAWRFYSAGDRMPS